jgi:hypothetical protein
MCAFAALAAESGGKNVLWVLFAHTGACLLFAQARKMTASAESLSRAMSRASFISMDSVMAASSMSTSGNGASPTFVGRGASSRDLHNAAMMDSASSMGASSMAESTDTVHGPGSPPAVAVAQQGSELLAGERPLEMSDPAGPRGQRHKRQQYADGGSNITQP